MSKGRTVYERYMSASHFLPPRQHTLNTRTHTHPCTHTQTTKYHHSRCCSITTSNHRVCIQKPLIVPSKHQPSLLHLHTLAHIRCVSSLCTTRKDGPWHREAQAVPLAPVASRADAAARLASDPLQRYGPVTIREALLMYRRQNTCIPPLYRLHGWIEWLEQSISRSSRKRFGATTYVAIWSSRYQVRLTSFSLIPKTSEGFTVLYLYILFPNISLSCSSEACPSAPPSPRGGGGGFGL